MTIVESHLRLGDKAIHWWNDELKAGMRKLRIKCCVGAKEDNERHNMDASKIL